MHMQHTDGLRRTAYAVAIALGLMAVFGWLSGSDSVAAILVAAAMAIVAIAEKLNTAAARSRRDRKLGRLTGG
jgi:heme exporter protein D